MGKGAIPDRWLNYKPIGNRIEGTRFIAFKVPLRTNVNGQVREANLRLDADILLEQVPNLGIIIDLTNTDRYYSPHVFTNVGVKHQKLMIPGKMTPSKKLSTQFNFYVMNFLNLNKDNDKLIGVHCTHGVNRTGYLICNYMISEMRMRPEEAIQKFADARGHKIERENYIQALQRPNTSKEGKSKEPEPHQENFPIRQRQREHQPKNRFRPQEVQHQQSGSENIRSRNDWKRNDEKTYNNRNLNDDQPTIAKFGRNVDSARLGYDNSDSSGRFDFKYDQRTYPNSNGNINYQGGVNFRRSLGARNTWRGSNTHTTFRRNGNEGNSDGCSYRRNADNSIRGGQSTQNVRRGTASRNNYPPQSTSRDNNYESRNHQNTNNLRPQSARRISRPFNRGQWHQRGRGRLEPFTEPQSDMYTWKSQSYRPDRSESGNNR